MTSPHRGRGRLVVVATPIGNLNDFSPRARAALAEAHLIAAEDTRHTRSLLEHCGLDKPLLSLFAHNERDRSQELTERLRAGEHIALVSDAGTPLLSDPGLHLVQAAIAAGAEVTAIPGPNAIAMALSLAGLPTERFAFEGFLPASAAARAERLAALAIEPRTLVFFEAPHRIAESLEALALAFGSERPAVVAREMTKFHESVYRGSLAELMALSQQDTNFCRGEITLVVAGAAVAGSATALPAEVAQRLARALAAELPPSRAAAILSQVIEIPRAEAYAWVRRYRPAADDPADKNKD